MCNFIYYTLARLTHHSPSVLLNSRVVLEYNSTGNVVHVVGLPVSKLNLCEEIDWVFSSQSQYKLADKIPLFLEYKWIMHMQNLG